MVILIILVILALGFGYFATQNTQLITITLTNYIIPDVPLYVILGATLILGFAISWIISLSDSLNKLMKIRGKENTIKDANKTIKDLEAKIKDLKIENARLKGELKDTPKA